MDWRKNGLPLESRAPLPENEVDFITSEELYSLLKKYDDCLDVDGRPRLTFLDLRNENFLNEEPPPAIATSCPTRILQLDDITREAERETLPKHGLIVTITETGNRDEFVIRYLFQFGFASIKGLENGMRGWLKHRFPIR